MKTLLTIAGFDPSSGAGITADLAVFAAHGYFGISAITALTVQSTQGVSRTQPVAPELLRETLAYLAADIDIAGVKIGMLATAANVEVVATFLATLQDVPIVLDPVLRASSGRELLDPAGVEALARSLLPKVTWVTPNRSELPSLGVIPPNVGVIVTAGDSDASDLVLANATQTWLHGEHLESRSTHGTGCAYASALLCNLVSAPDGLQAARNAKQYVTEAIRRAPRIGRGTGPMALYWPLQRP